MNYNKIIDHTILKADTTKTAVEKTLREALDHDFASVCINPYWVPLAAEVLKGSDVKVCTVIGFPLGANTTNTKVFETRDAIANGANEIDMVINIGELKAGNYDVVQKDIEAVVEESKGKALVKVIIETCLLTKEEIEKVSDIVRDSGADFIKTSTGFSTGGATVEGVALMRKHVGENVGVKASGGVRTPEIMKAMVEAGATRIGTSNGVY
ncbi:deoxyribose-phosphate aldolase [Peribacillus huizhouensis]|uniref:Deoxyribose-phosphate aldolase n=1 Tax=Peribacillus huizhouensis TaxID=1501239 RepID=A0ABR6CR64_9BACI|nr:deoxyribose-phosphate aldolase [Peribacillus huizhouensis]MBA9026832.1 deoxyribose-phosphate aldolase [Peribacillus huizhouensis]